MLLWDRDETRDVSVRDRDATETLRILFEMRSRWGVSTSRDCLETKTSRPRPHPWFKDTDLTKFNIVQIFHCIFSWKCNLLTNTLSVIDRFSCIYISQGSVATQLMCGGIFSNHFIANCPQNVLVKEFWKSVNIWPTYRQSQSRTFFGTQCSNHLIVTWSRVEPMTSFDFKFNINYYTT